MRSIDELLRDLNGDALVMRTEHVGPLRFTGFTEGGMGQDGSLFERADFGLITHLQTMWFREAEPLVRVPPEVRQCDPRWGNKRYAPQGSLTYCQAACLVCSAASLAGWAGCLGGDETVEDFARKIGKAGAFKGDELGHPSAVTRAYPRLVWHGRGDRAFHSPLYGIEETSFVNWRKRPADMGLLAEILKRQPVVVEVDYEPETKEVNQHFTLAYKYLPDPEDGLMDDLLVMDPMTGLTSVLTYFNPDWLGEWMRQNEVSRVARTLTGLRVWEVVGE